MPKIILKIISIILGVGGGQPDDGKFHHVFTLFFNPSLIIIYFCICNLMPVSEPESDLLIVIIKESFFVDGSQDIDVQVPQDKLITLHYLTLLLG